MVVGEAYDFLAHFVAVDNATTIDAIVPVHAFVKHDLTCPTRLAATRLARMNLMIEVPTTVHAVRSKVDAIVLFLVGLYANLAAVEANGIAQVVHLKARTLLADDHVTLGTVNAALFVDDRRVLGQHLVMMVAVGRTSTAHDQAVFVNVLFLAILHHHFRDLVELRDELVQKVVLADVIVLVFHVYFAATLFASV